MSFIIYTLITLFIIVCVFLILVVLIQKGRGGGLASAFGGGGGGSAAFGAKTGDVLTWVTSIIFGVFLLLAVALNILADRHQRNAPVRAPIAPVAPIAGGDATPGTAVPPLTTDSRPTQDTPASALPLGATGTTGGPAAGATTRP